MRADLSYSHNYSNKGGYVLLKESELKTPIEMDGKLRKERWPVYPDHEH